MNIENHINIMPNDVQKFNIEVHIENETVNEDVQFIMALAYKLINSTIRVEFLSYLEDVQKINRKEVHDIMLALSYNLKKTKVKIEYVNSELLDIALYKLNEILEMYSRLYGINIGILKNDSSYKYKIELKNSDGIDSRNVLGRQLYYLDNREFNINDTNRHCLKKLLTYISPYEKFKDGQLESLEKIINSKSNVACLMPTGSGKSLIFFMLNYLRLGTTLVVSPTDVLIEDQIYQLHNTHNIDDVSYLKFPCATNFHRYNVVNSFVYVEPIMLLSKYLKRNFMYQQFAYIIFDEVHCMSSIGHDFRPEYLMVATNLQKLNNVQTIGFTATVNYAIAKDIKEDLGIKNENFFSPIPMKKENISFNFIGVEDTIESIDKVIELGIEIVKQNKRALIFAKNDDYTVEIKERIGKGAIAFKKDDKTSYREFVKGKHNILVSNEYIGVGINFPNITEIIHMGFPVSMSDYIQEVGRGGRNSELVLSNVVYLKNSSGEISEDTINRAKPMHELLESINEDNDIIDGYNMIRNFISSPEEYISGFNEMIKKLEVLSMIDVTNYDFKKYLHYCYSGYKMGHISDWGVDSAIDGVDYHFTITNHLLHTTSFQKKMKTYADWFFTKYLHNKKEIFLDMIDFIWYFAGKDNAILRNILAQNSSLDMETIETFAYVINNSTIEEINSGVHGFIGYDRISSLEKSLSNMYDYKAEYVVVIYEMNNYGVFNKQRFERILSKCTSNDRVHIFKGLINSYNKLEKNEKVNLIKMCTKHGHNTEQILNQIYINNPRDELYYQIISLKLGRKVESYGKGNK